MRGLAPGGPRGWGLGRAAERHPAGLPPSGGDLHYHLSQHGVFSEADMRFYAAEIILGLEHMHNRFVVYRNLKVRLCPPPPSPPRHWPAWPRAVASGTESAGCSLLHRPPYPAIFWTPVVAGERRGRPPPGALSLDTHDTPG